MFEFLHLLFGKFLSVVLMLEILDNGDSENHTKKKTKRMRTTFTEEQVQILQANFSSTILW